MTFNLEFMLLDLLDSFRPLISLILNSMSYKELARKSAHLWVYTSYVKRSQLAP
jgi:hypothetical protein